MPAAEVGVRTAVGTVPIGVDFRSHSRRRTRSRWPARLLRMGAVIFALGSLSLGLATAVIGGNSGPYETMTVQPGDTLWSIARDRYPGTDVRARVFQIEQTNHLRGPSIMAGDRLQVPTR